MKKNEVQEFLQEKMGINGVADCDKKLEYYGLNSIDFIRLVVEIEEKYSIVFDDENLDFVNYDSLSQLIEYVVSKIK